MGHENFKDHSYNIQQIIMPSIFQISTFKLACLFTLR